MKLKDWEFVFNFATTRCQCDVATVEKYKAEADNFPGRKRLHSMGPLLYQDYVYVLFRALQPQYVVETGVRYGVCTSLMLGAMEQNAAHGGGSRHDEAQADGTLVSCDPMYAGSQEARTKIEECLGMTSAWCPWDRWRFMAGRSNDRFNDHTLLEEMLAHVDVFVHDSDHSFDNMTWELEVALRNLRPDSIIVCDDWDWADAEDQRLGNLAAGTCVEQFCKKHGLTFNTVGTAAVIEVR